MALDLRSAHLNNNVTEHVLCKRKEFTQIAVNNGENRVFLLVDFYVTSTVDVFLLPSDPS